MKSERIWVERTENKIPAEISQNFKNKFIQQRLFQNGISDAKAAKAFIDSNLYTPAPASQLPDLEKAAARIQNAIDKGEKIGIWGDFDVDGQTSTTILVQGLRALGADPVYHIPNRQLESHGIKVSYLQTYLETGINLLVTCDTGVSEFDAIQFANASGIDVVITDHHSLPAVLPDAIAIVNPKRLPPGHALSSLAGVGTAYKLIEYLYTINNRKVEAAQFLDLVALGTIADVADLNPENHYLVQKGLQALRETPRLLIKELFLLKKINPSNLDEQQIGFYIAPLLNSIGRLDDANAVVDHMLSEDLLKVRVFANILDNLNDKRKLLTEQITQAALSRLENGDVHQQNHSIVLYHPDWVAGVLGIVANKLVEVYQKPVILLCNNQSGGISGSGRSIQEINLILAIQECGDLLEHFGGHAMAAGVSLQNKNLDAFIIGLNNAVAHQMKTAVFRNELMLDGYLEFNDITLDFAKEISSLAPYGAGNPPFTFAGKNIDIQKINTFGRGGKHARLITTNADLQPLEFLWWQGAENKYPNSRVDLAFHLRVSSFNTQEQVEIEIVDMRLAESEKIALSDNSTNLEVIDWRKKNIQFDKFFSQYPNSLIWAEGIPLENDRRIVDRYGLQPADCLLILTCPPSWIELAKVWKIVNPKVVILGNVIPNTDSINKLIPQILGMVKYALKNTHGNFDIHKAAAKTGQRAATIKSLLQYLAAAGYFSMHEHKDSGITLTPSNAQDRELQSIAENLVRFMLRETSSFRNLYLNTASDQVMNEIVSFFAPRN